MFFSPFDGRAGWDGLTDEETQMKRITLITIAAMLGALMVATAQAGLIFIPTTYGLSARSAGLGNAMTGVGGDYSTTFYNPAALGSIKTNQLDFGYLLAVPDFKGGPEGDSNAVKFDTANKALLVGFTMNLSNMFKNKHGLGLGFDMVLDNNTKSFMNFEDVRSEKGQFLRYGLSSVTMVTGLGVEIIPQLYVGGGGFIMVKGKNKLIADTDMGGNTSQEEIQVSAEPAIAPMGSVFAPINETVSIGAIYRGKGVAEFSSINAQTEATVSQSPLTELNLMMAFKDTYIPQQAALGVAVHPVKPLMIAMDGTWANWGDYDDEVKEGEVVKDDAKFKTRDIVIPRIGIEYLPVESVALRLGYFYEMTPFKDPGIGQNVVLDNDKHAVSIGASHHMAYIPGLAHPVTIGASYFLHHLVPRTVEAGDGTKFKSGGNLQGLIGTLTLRF
jgi:long-chain fatty acid transport protein